MGQKEQTRDRLGADVPTAPRCTPAYWTAALNQAALNDGLMIITFKRTGDRFHKTLHDSTDTSVYARNETKQTVVSLQLYRKYTARVYIGSMGRRFYYHLSRKELNHRRWLGIHFTLLNLEKTAPRSVMGNYLAPKLSICNHSNLLLHVSKFGTLESHLRYEETKLKHHDGRRNRCLRTWVIQAYPLQ